MAAPTLKVEKAEGGFKINYHDAQGSFCRTLTSDQLMRFATTLAYAVRGVTAVEMNIDDGDAKVQLEHPAQFITLDLKSKIEAV